MDDGLRGDLLGRLYDVLASPLRSIVRELSALLAPYVAHSALVVLAADTSGGRLQGTGDAAFIRGVSGLELDRLRREAPSVEAVRRTSLLIEGVERSVLLVLSRNDAVLVVADPGPLDDPSQVLDIWNIVALHVQERADEAAPEYLQHARATSGARLKALTELADEYSMTLESVLSILRSPRVGDAEARGAGIVRAADGLVSLRTASDQVRTLTEEPVMTAFDRLKEDLRPMTRHREIEVQFVDPPTDGRPLPGEVARGARAVVRRALLSLVDLPGVGRARVQWDCDGTNLLMSIRDDGPGTMSGADAVVGGIRQRIQALNGRLSVDATPGWGTELSAVIPLDPPRAHAASAAMAHLRPREVQVAALLAAGYRNRAIADELGISENTVKFHVSRILQKLGTASRGEAIAVLLAAKGS
ncbi:helix-turn-helix transcriptional regulator [Microbacterium karelineae]|uniref:helix-turn-helix transcriptional regulator n=1 Tax=Microbacterium karelineae TaxID=2654283 RepID=UPI0012EAB9FD|nr:LuxR C-terminal-related transcriptional regulator [Microbacterium karelineae]